MSKLMYFCFITTCMLCYAQVQCIFKRLHHFSSCLDSVSTQWPVLSSCSQLFTHSTHEHWKYMHLNMLMDQEGQLILWSNHLWGSSPWLSSLSSSVLQSSICWWEPTQREYKLYLHVFVTVCSSVQKFFCVVGGYTSLESAGVCPDCPRKYFPQPSLDGPADMAHPNIPTKSTSSLSCSISCGRIY